MQQMQSCNVAPRCTGSASDCRLERHRQPGASLRQDGVRESKPPPVWVCGKHPPGSTQVGVCVHNCVAQPRHQADKQFGLLWNLTVLQDCASHWWRLKGEMHWGEPCQTLWVVVKRSRTQSWFLQQYHTTGTRPDPAERSPAEEHSVGARRGGLHWTRHQTHAGRTRHRAHSAHGRTEYFIPVHC